MDNINKNKIIDELCLTVAKTLSEVGVATGAGFNVWPMPIFHPIEGEIYTAPYFIPRLYKALISLQKRGYNNQEIARFLKNPSRIAQIVWLFSASDLVPLKKEEKADLAFRLVKLISTYRKDPFCKKKTNIIWQSEEVEENLKKAIKIKCTKDSKKLLGKLNGLAWLLCELLYFDFHGVGHEIHGPYQLDGSNRILVVREYYDMRPEHWKFASQLSFNKILTLEIYNGAKIEFDFFNRTRWVEPISQYLQEFSILVDDQSVKKLNKLMFIVNELKKILTIGANKVTKMNKKELIKKFAESYFFIIKPLIEDLGEIWMPPKSLYQEIDEEKKKGIIEKILLGLKGTEGKSKEEFIKILSFVLDPRK